MDLREVPQTPFQRHPWEVARARFFSQIVRARVSKGRPLNVLDIGAGDGYFARTLLSRLPDGSRCLCVDPNYTDTHLQELTAGSSKSLSFTRHIPSGRWDLVTLLDVIEHVKDDGALLLEVAEKRLAADGHVLISVPAFMALYSQHDAFLGHYRRYRASELSTLAHDAGFELLVRGGLFFGLLPVRVAQKLGERIRGHRAAPGDENFATESEVASWSHGWAPTAMANLLLAADAATSRLLAALALPVPGLSVWVLGRKAIRSQRGSR